MSHLNFRAGLKSLSNLLKLCLAGLLLASCSDVQIPVPGTDSSINTVESQPASPQTESLPLPAATETQPLPSPSPTFTETPSPTPTIEPTPTEAINREFDLFVASVMNGDPSAITGVYVEGVLALPVVQQPPGEAAWVSYNDDEATQFLLAYTIAGNVGLIAHNYLAGRYFFNLQPGQIVELIYGDGSVVEYEITEIDEYQALQPQSPYSDFLDLVTGETITANDLFYRVYGGEHHLTFQTCISRDNNTEWGRLFPVAYPYQ